MARQTLSARHALLRRLAVILAALLALYLLLAYALLPYAWTHYERQPKLAARPMVTATAQGIPGDPINVALVGDREDVVLALDRAGWFPADPTTLASAVEIVGSVVLGRPYRDAPVSNLYYEGRRQELAYEKPSGRSADTRHHVRLWRVLERGEEDRPVWLGAATFDRGVGFSHYTGAVTHHIDADLDAERDLLVGDLVAAHMADAIYQVSGVGPTLNGRNGEGDRYFTDGEIHVARLVTAGRGSPAEPKRLDPPLHVRLKDRLWQRARALLAAR